MKEDSIDKFIEETIRSAELIEPARISTSFKNRVLNAVTEEELPDETPVLFAWFTPRYQVAVLICVVLLNLVALFFYNTQAYEESVSELAETYGLFDEDSESIINFN